jgi:hypothetical protein
MSQFGLFRERRFAPFFGTQFLGAFNDNLYKNAVVILIAFSGLSAAQADALVNLAAGIFILPFFLFSATSGQLADKLEKSRLIRAVKLAEIVIMALAAVGLLLESVPLLLVVLFSLGAQATVFGPVKYSILPQHLRSHELVGGNGLVEMGTFIAILVGTIAGGLLVALRPIGPLVVAGAGLAVAVLGWLASRAIPNAPAASPALVVRYEPFSQTWSLLRHARRERVVWLAIHAISWFWFYGAVFLAQFPGYARSVLGAGEQVVTLMLAAFSVGIGVGSTLCERLSRGRIDLGVTLFGAIGLSLFAVDLFFASPAPLAEPAPGALVGVLELCGRAGSVRIVGDLLLIGLFGGFFIVPLYALMQQRSSVEHRSRVIAANNVLNAAYMVVASIVAIALRAAGMTIPVLLLVTALANALVALALVWRMPTVGSRFVLWLGVRLLFRLRVRGLGELPREGAARVVAPRSSPHAALLFAALCPRAPELVVPTAWLRQRRVGWLLRAEGATASATTASSSAVGPANEAPDRAALVALFTAAAAEQADGPRADEADAGSAGVWQLTVTGLPEGAAAEQSFSRFVLSHLWRPIELTVRPA